MKEQSGTFERQLLIRPAFDKTDPNPHKNYGVGALTFRFVLKGPLGAVQFVMSSGWYLTHVRPKMAQHDRDWLNEGHDSLLHSAPMAFDLGYHSPSPRYEEQSKMEHCDILPHGQCYYDGSTLNAEPVMEQFIAEGEEAVWQELEKYYQNLFVPETVEATL